MCLLAVLFRVHPEMPLVIAANRDEQFTRPTDPMLVLRPAAPKVLGGRDALAGGTWLAVNQDGVCVGLTNRPSVSGRDGSLRSRGELPLMLAKHARASDAAAEFQEKVQCSEYNPCWLLVGDRETLFYIVVGSDERPDVTPLPPGIHVLENRPLNAVSAKVGMIRQALLPAGGWSGPTLLSGLQGVLRSHDLPAKDLPDDEKEDPHPRPAAVQSACVHTAAYGTRSATLIFVRPEPEPPRVHYADGPPCVTSFIGKSYLWEIRT